MFSVLGRRSGLHKVVSRYIQGSQFFNKKMGSSYTKSYSPSEFKGQNLQSRQSATDAACTGTICSMSNEKYVESVVCHKDDLQDNEMKVFELGEEGRVLLVKQNGNFNAVGTKCSHYGAPLVNGALGKGRIRCPWHGACFNVKTGDIEDFPGFDSIPTYPVTVTEKGEVKVRARVRDLESNIRIKDMHGLSPCDSNAVVIIGGGPSGATCAETLRSEGFRGRLVLVCKEPYRPYDRIKVSKIGTVPPIERLQARTADYYQKNGIEVLTNVEATKVDTQDRLVHLSDGNQLRYTALYIATGSKPRLPNIPGIQLQKIFTVREYDDAVNIMNTLGDNKDKNVVVIGSSFLGLEIAASCFDKAKSITVVGRDTAPLNNVFGSKIGERLKKLFEEKGVKFVFRTTIAQCFGDQEGKVKSVQLENEQTLEADMLILCIGTTYNTGFLSGSDIRLNPDGAVPVNGKLETNVSGVFVGGDIAYAPVFVADNKPVNIGHVGLAQYHGRTAALNILKKETSLHTVPYFWTQLFGKSIRYAGHGKHTSTVVVGDIDELKFVEFFLDANDKVIAVASCMRDPVVSQFAELLHQGKTLTKKDLQGEDPLSWTATIH